MKRPTLVDVAQRAGVSQATVSYVVNKIPNGRVPISAETRKRVLEAVAELGYEPNAQAQALRSGKSNTIAFIITDIRNPHYADYTVGIEEEATTNGYHVLISNTDLNNENSIVQFRDLARQRIDGLILASSFILGSDKAKTILTKLVKRKFPIVELSSWYGIDGVLSDYQLATVDVMNHLFSLGHRQIGMVYGVSSYETADDRLQPYLDCLREAGIPHDPGLVVECGPTLEDGYRAAKKLLMLPSRPTAVIGINDLMALGILRASADLGMHIPGDLSVVGYDDIPMSNYLVPRLTTVTKDAVKLGRTAFQLLSARIQDPSIPFQQVKIPAKLIIRESTAKAPE